MTICRTCGIDKGDLPFVFDGSCSNCWTERNVIQFYPKKDMSINKDDLIVVCGAGGFIGGHLVGELIHRGHTNIKAVDIKPYKDWWQKHLKWDDYDCWDLSLRGTAGNAVRGAKIVFNLAADMGGIEFIERNKAKCMLSVLINTHLLQASLASGVEKYFYASSACVYNADKQRDPNVTALKEEDAYPAMPEEGYGFEKLFGELMCRYFMEDFGIKTYVARYHNIMGEFGTWEGGREKAPAAFCRKIALAKIRGDKEIEIWGSGEQTRSFCHVSEAVDGTLRLIESDVHEPINIGSDELVSINVLVDIIEDIAGVKLKRKYFPNEPHGVNGRNSDNTKIKERLGWAPSMKLRDGLERVYKWVFDEVKRKYG